MQTIYSSVGSKAVLLRTVVDTMDAQAGVQRSSGSASGPPTTRG